MIMTKEALKESYASYMQSYEEVQNNIQTVMEVCLVATVIVVIVAVLATILKRSPGYVLMGIGALTAIWFGFTIFSTSTEISLKKGDNDLNYKINTIMPYLFKNEETADTLKRYDKINIQIDQDELLNTGVIKGQVVVDDNGKELIYPFNQITLGVTSEPISYLELNTMDVELNEEYPKGKVFNVLYLNDIDYTTFMNLFGEIPIRIEK